MDNYYGEESGWDPTSFPLPDSVLFENDGRQLGDFLDSGYNLEQALAEYTTDPRASTNPQNPRKHEQVLQKTSPDTERAGRRTMVLEPMPAQRRKLRAFSPDAVERRRKQNRASQIAFRERSRKKMEDLHQELSMSTKYNQQLYQTMRGLLEQTEVLKAAIEKALASFPLSNPESLSQASSEYYGWTPSDSEGPAMEFESTSA